MSKINVLEPRRPKLSKVGVLTFMSPSGYGLVCRASVCQTPTCPCQDVILHMVPIDFRVESVTLNRDGLSLQSRRLGGLGSSMSNTSPILARLNPHSGQLIEDGERTHHAEALLVLLREALDGELLDDFARLWRRLKGLPRVTDEPRRDPDLGDWKSGEALAFGQVFEQLRDDGYPLGNKIYEVVDHYCAEPSCDCREVIVDFFYSDGGGNDGGAATIDLATGDVSFTHATNDETLVPTLWKRFVHRHRGVALLFDRQERMKDFGQTFLKKMKIPPQMPKSLAALEGDATSGRQQAQPKIGRNVRCPCGSGKKHKKCCLVRLSS